IQSDNIEHLCYPQIVCGHRNQGKERIRNDQPQNQSDYPKRRGIGAMPPQPVNLDTQYSGSSHQREIGRSRFVVPKILYDLVERKNEFSGKKENKDQKRNDIEIKQSLCDPWKFQ